ncbi:hypothetical protein [Streptomyces tsukubensis]|uniref:Secreted protein n=1 Tax=Streptomyces tsukubensis TaxID=83656 RepID=A0A1V4A700_9ACTN|nr:hypothetical protein [Streptomyces tsukubensis]OON77008.1 hypothetical protein B1H18_19920 [Streptomyces tsukubensis]QFR93753.1 hypothetical protein GBW32_12575 [Streptomyces tsukubensis]
MISQRIKRAAVSIGVVTIATVGAALGTAGVAQADRYVQLYTYQYECQSAADQANAQMGGPDNAYYCTPSGSQWALYMKTT